jgi:hypothetical protein
MKNNGRFMVGLVGMAAVVTYLIWTGISETMVYYVTPLELIERVEADPSFHEVGVKVGAMVIPGSYARVEGELLHVFTVRDLVDESITFVVEFRDALPDTFTDDTRPLRKIWRVSKGDAPRGVRSLDFPSRGHLGHGHGVCRRTHAAWGPGTECGT